MSFADMWSARHVQIGVGKTSCPKMGSAVGHQHANEMASCEVVMIGNEVIHGPHGVFKRSFGSVFRCVNTLHDR